MSLNGKERCKCCGREIENPRGAANFKYSDFDGFAHSSNNDMYVCTKCLERNLYVNNYGYHFLKAKDCHTGKQEVYVKMPMCSEFSRVRSDEQIKQAFDPDYYAFKTWLSIL